MKRIQEFLSQRPTGTLYHYTDAVGLMGIFRHKELWATNVSHLNDASEFKHAYSLLYDEIQSRLQDTRLSDETRQVWTDYFANWNLAAPEVASSVISLSAAGNQLSQWRAYCPRGNGYSLGFSYSDLVYARKVTRTILVRCVYEATQQRELISAVAEYMERSVIRSHRVAGWGQLTFIHHAFRKVLAAMLALKNRGFEEENEWRLVVDESAPTQFRHGRFGILPYSAVPLCAPADKPTFTQIYIGPHPEPKIAENALVDFLRTEVKLNQVHERVKQSTIPYRY